MSVDVRIVRRRIVPLAAAAAAVAVLLQGGVSQAQTTAAKPTLKQQVAEVTSLSNQVDELGQQVDALKLQLSQAKSQVKTAKKAQLQVQRAMAGDVKAVAQLAAMGYMSGGSDPTLQVITSNDPGQMLGQASIAQQVSNEAGMRVATLRSEQHAAMRAQVTAGEEITNANKIQAELDSKVTTINAKLSVLNSSVNAQALAIFNQTGSIPSYVLPAATSVATRALRAAVGKVGDPYLWGAAGPSEFDCSGLIVWAFAQEGITLPHYTGSLWNEGEHVSRSDLRPGDLVFFDQSIDHAGIYLGNNLMVDAPHTGAFVRVESLASWDSQYVGAVRIV